MKDIRLLSLNYKSNPFFFRLFASSFRFLVVIVTALFLSEHEAERVYLFQIAALVSAGWISLSFRQKLFALFNSTEEIEDKSSYKLAIISFFIISLFISFSLSLSLNNHDISFKWYTYFIFILGMLIQSLSFSYLWLQKKLHLSYLIDVIPSIALLLAIFIYQLGIQHIIFIWCFLNLVIGSFVFFKIPIWPYVKRIQLNRDIIAAWINSEIIVLISYCEIFWLGHMIGKSQIIEYRIILGIVMFIATIGGVIRQIKIANNNVNLSKNLGLFILIFASISMFVFLVLINSGIGNSDIVLVGSFFIVLSLAQVAFSSYVSYLFDKEMQSYKGMLASIATLITAFIVFSFFGPYDNYTKIFAVKSTVICVNIISVLVFFFLGKDLSKQ